jgi:hypothetical protein
MSSSAIITAPLTTAQIHRFLSILSSLLPYSIPIYRRIQWHLRHPPPAESIDKVETVLSISSPDIGDAVEDLNAHDIIDTWLDTHLEQTRNITEPGKQHSLLQNPWITAHLDLANPGTTQAFTFGSFEVPIPTSSSPQSNNESLHTTLFHSLLHHIYSTLIPNLPSTPPPTWLYLRDNGKWLSEPYSRSKILFGSTHENIRGLIPDNWTARRDGWYNKYIFPPTSNNGGVVIDTSRNGKACGGLSYKDVPSRHKGGLGEEYDLGHLERGELQMILDGSPIPRTMGYLLEVVNCGVYYLGEERKGRELVGYGFLNKDASLGGLLVREEHQKRGLASVLAGALFGLQEETFSLPEEVNRGIRETREDREGWFASSDVGEENVASRRVMEKLGGEKMWRVCWVEIDLDVMAGVKAKYGE